MRRGLAIVITIIAGSALSVAEACGVGGFSLAPIATQVSASSLTYGAPLGGATSVKAGHSGR